MALKSNKLFLTHAPFLGVISLLVGASGILFTAIMASQMANPFTNLGSASNPHPLNLAVSVSPVGKSENVKIIATWTKYRSQTYQYFLSQRSPSAKIIQAGYTGNNRVEIVRPLENGSYNFTVNCYRNEGKDPSTCKANTTDTVSFSYNKNSASATPGVPGRGLYPTRNPHY